jgi:hypothetical protein
MLKEETYMRASDEFGTSVGVASIVSYKTRKKKIDELSMTTFKSLSIELTINGIVCESIEAGLYQELQREIYKIKLTNKRIKKELSIYKKAWNNIIND